MKKSYFWIIIILLLSTISVCAQKKRERKYTYGILKGTVSYEGFFFFDSIADQSGQRIYYKPTLDTKKEKLLYPIRFETFESDSVFRRNFKTILYGTGRLQAMVVRIINGELELYDVDYKSHYLSKKVDHFFLYDRRNKNKIRLTRLKFKDQMQEILVDDKEILSKIENGELNYEQLPAIIYNYNLRRAGKGDSKNEEDDNN
jgi:hypothetical protein